MACFLPYKLKFTEEIDTAILNTEIDKPLVLALIKQESKFDNTALSSKGALGLMQIMPKTAEWLCERMGIEYDEEKLKNADFNINLGVSYLDYLSKKFEKLEYVLMAYNAGEGVVSAWIEKGIFQNNATPRDLIDAIPYGETKIYVRNILKFRERYDKMIK